jgi:SSS family solute:Na+ symporter
VLIFSILVCLYAIASEGTPIYEMVSSTYQITVVGAFIPLVAGLYWKRATTQGAIFAIAAGMLGWLLFTSTSLGEAFPAQLAGLILSAIAMLFGSLAPQLLRNHGVSHHPHAGMEQKA